MLWQTYYRPRRVTEAVEILASNGQARLIAGATDLAIQLRCGEVQVDSLVDVTRIADLDYIRDQDGLIEIGALVTHTQASKSELLKEKAHLLAQACSLVGSLQIRNLGTLAGNIISASPANDSIPPLVALGAQVSVSSAMRGERIVPLDKFVLGVNKTALLADEMLTQIAFPALKKIERGIFIKLGLRQAQAISVVNVAVVVTFAADVIATGDATNLPIKHVRIALGSVAPTAVLAAEAQEFLVGKTLSDAAIAETGHLAVKAAIPISDVRASAEYRREMVRVLVERALRQLRDHRARAFNV